MLVIQQAPRLFHGEYRDARRFGQFLELGGVHGVTGRVSGDDHRFLGAFQ